MKNKIVISKPYIRECKSDIFNNAVRLCANVTMINPNNQKKESKECFFEFELKYKEYLCPERSDAFVMGLLTTAMENNMDIVFESPISEKLYYQLTTYYIPMVSKYNSYYPLYNIKLIGPYSDEIIANKKAVATGCSGGVDSFYTIAKHLDKNIPDDYKLTHIIYNSSATSDILEDRIVNNFKNIFTDMKKLASDCNLKTIGCYNNLYLFYKFPFRGFLMFFTATFSSVPYALQKLISVYYMNSGASTADFNIDLRKANGYDASAFDILTTQCINSENLVFYSAGTEVERIEKEKFISKYIPATKNLIVCDIIAYRNQKNKFINCSMCKKCIRTMNHLYALGELKKFNKVFDTKKFLKNKNKYIGKMFAVDKVSYINEFKNACKQNNIKIPISSYFYSFFWYKPIKFLRKIFRNSFFARKIFYNFNIDYKLDGFRHSTYEAYKNKIKK